MIAHLELGSLLGAGGSGAVLRARDTRTGAEVAVKVLHAHLARDEAAVTRFLAQARLTRGLRHPNLATTLAAGRDAGLVWATMPLVEGVTVTELLDHEGPLPVADAAAITAAVLTGLTAAHGHGLVHLDLSAGNVMVPAGGPAQAVVLDLGGSPAEPDVVRVSPHFAAPEVATGAPAGPAADVYSACCLLHLMLTGRPPFVAESAQGVLEAQVGAVPRAPSQLRAGLPVALDRLVLAGLAKDPDARPGAAELAAELRGLAAGPGGAGLSGAGAPRGTRRRAAHTLPATPALAAVGAGYVPPAPVPPARVEQPRATGLRLLGVGAVLSVLVVAGVTAAQAGAEPPPAPVVTRSATPSPTPTPTPTSSTTSAPEPDALAVPQVVGLTADDASAAVLAAGLVPDVVLVDLPGVAGAVLGVEPGVGTAVPPESVVTLSVVSGYVLVPDVGGLTASAARSQLESAGLDPRPARPLETVASTEPAAGTRVLAGTTVLLHPAVVPPTAEPTTEPTAGPTPEPTPEPTPTASPTVHPTEGPTPTPDPDTNG